jgi:hypothetical protein
MDDLVTVVKNSQKVNNNKSRMSTDCHKARQIMKFSYDA